MYFETILLDGGMGMDNVLVAEQMPIVTQTSHEEVVEKIEKEHKLQASVQFFGLQKEFINNLICASEIIFGLYNSGNVKQFCNRLSAEERFALEKSMRHHPSVKALMATFFSFGFVVIGITAWVFSFLPPMSMLVPPICVVPFLPYFMERLPVINYFFLRRKLIRLGGPKAVENTIKEMELYC